MRELVLVGISFAIAAWVRLALLRRGEAISRPIAFASFAICSSLAGAFWWALLADGPSRKRSATRGAAVGALVWGSSHPVAWFVFGVVGSKYSPLHGETFGATERLGAALAGATFGWFVTSAHLLPPSLFAGALLGWLAARPRSEGEQR